MGSRIPEAVRMCVGLMTALCGWGGVILVEGWELPGVDEEQRLPRHLLGSVDYFRVL